MVHRAFRAYSTGNPAALSVSIIYSRYQDNLTFLHITLGVTHDWAGGTVVFLSAPGRIRQGLSDEGTGESRLTERSVISYHRLMVADFRDVDPAELRLPPPRLSGADPYKFQRQIARYGASSEGMPPVWVYEGSDGVLEIINGATRATRIAKLSPGTTIRVEVIGRFRGPRGPNPKVGDRR